MCQLHVSVHHCSLQDRVDWQDQLIKAMWRAKTAESAESARSEIASMLLHLGDPYTRIVPRGIYDDYESTSQGSMQGVGLLLASDSASKNLVVVAPMRNGPAERAGIRQGDVLVGIDGKATRDMDSQYAGSLLRGASGSSVNVQVKALLILCTHT
jgi:carboxyl-terminal processing protease